MKLTRLFLPSYGPLTTIDYQFEPGFNLFFGPNEKGKSLTIDALTRLIMGKAAQKLPKIDRVDAEPGKLGGWLEISSESNSAAAPSQKSSPKTSTQSVTTKLSRLQGLNIDWQKAKILAATDWPNLLIVRNSQLEIGELTASESEYYTQLTQRLVGLHSSLIQQLITEIRDQAELSPTDKTKNTTQNQRLADRLQAAQKLLTPDSILNQLLADQNWSNLIAQQLQLQTKLNQLEQELNWQDLVYQKEQLAQLETNWQQANQLQTDLDQLSSINPNQLASWQKAATNLANYQEQLAAAEQLHQELVDSRAQIYQAQQENEAATAALTSSPAKLATLATKLSELTQAWTAIGDSQPQTNRLLIPAGWLTTLLVGLNFKFSSPVLIVLTIISAVITLALIIKAGWQQHRHQHWPQKLNELKILAAQAQITWPANKATPEAQLLALNGALSARQNLLDQQHDQSIKFTAQLAAKDQAIDQNQHQISAGKTKIADQKKIIAELQHQTHCLKPAQLESQLNQKQKWQQQLAAATAVLAAKWPVTTITATTFKQWAHHLQDLATKLTDLDLPTNYRFSATQKNQLNQQLIATKQHLAQIGQNLIQVTNQLSDLEKQAQQILVTWLDPPPVCQSRPDLVNLHQNLTAFITDYQHRQQLALTAIATLTTINQTEQAQVSQLFPSGGLASQYLRQITNQKYQDIIFDQQQLKIFIRDQAGNLINPHQLSAGAYDQLYLAIRLNLAQRLLGNRPGFLILDDPFIRADAKRLENQLQILQQLCQQGWQLLYFTAKNEVVTALESAINNKTVKFFSLATKN